MPETITLGPRSVPLLGAALRERCKEPEQQLKCSFLLASLRDDFNEHKGTWTAAQYRRSYAIRRAHADTLLEGWAPSSRAPLGEQMLGFATGLALKFTRSAEGEFIGPFIRGSYLAVPADAIQHSNQLDNRSFYIDEFGGRFDSLLAEVQGACLQDGECNKGLTEADPDIKLYTDGKGLAAGTPADVLKAKPDVIPRGIKKRVKKDGTIEVKMGPIELVERISAVTEAASKKTAETAALAAEMDRKQDDLLTALTDPAFQQRVMEITEDWEQTRSTALNVLSGLTAIASVFDQKTAKDIRLVGMAAIETADAGVTILNAVAQATAAALSGNPIGVVNAAFTALGAAFDLAGVFSDGPSPVTPEQEIIKQVAAVRDDIRALAGQMTDRFDRIDAGLNQIYTTMLEQLEPIQVGIGSISLDVARVQQTLGEQAVSLRRIEDRLSVLAKTESRRALRGTMNAALGWRDRHTKPMPLAKFTEFADVLRNYAIDYAYDPIEVGDTGRDLSDHALAHELGLPLHENVAFLDAYLRERGWPGFVEREPNGRGLPNPFTWSAAASAYAQLLYEWPDHAATLTPANSLPIAEGGRKLERAFASIRDDAHLFKCLSENYEAKLDTFATALQTEADGAVAQLVATELGHPPGEPGLLLWGAPAQPLAYRPAGLQKVTAADGSGEEVPAPATLLSFVPPLCINRDWLAGAGSGALAATYAAALLDIKKLPSHPKEDPPPPNRSSRVRSIVTITFDGLPVARRSFTSGTTMWHTEAPPTGQSGVEAAFGPHSHDDGLTQGEADAARALLERLAGEVEELMGSHQRRLDEHLAALVATQSPPPEDAIATTAIELSGARALLDSCANLAFARAREGDDVLRALLDGAPGPAGVALADRDAFASMLMERKPIVARNGAEPSRTPVADWARATATRSLGALKDRIAFFRTEARAGNHIESPPLVKTSLLRLQLVETVTHPQEPEEDIVSQLPTVKHGAKGANVRRVQGLLRAANPKLTDNELPVSGTYGPSTAEAVKAVQKKRRLAVTGDVDEPTWRALLGVPR